MAAKPKEGTHGKERWSPSPSTPQHIDGPNGRRTPKLPAAGSTGRDNSIPMEKATPHYLRPTASSIHESNKPSKKPASIDVTTKNLTRRTSFNKLPSPSQTQRMTRSASSKEKSLKPSSPPKTASSPKPISDKTPKILRNGKDQLPVTAKILKKETSAKKRESKGSPTTTTGTATSSHDITKKLANMPKEDKAVHGIALETKVEGEEQAINEIQTIDHVDTEPDIYDKNVASNTSFPLEEHEEVTAVEKEDKKNYDCEGTNHNEEKEQGNIDEEHEGELSQQPEENSATDTHEQTNREHEEEDHDDDRRVRIHENAENGKLELKERVVGSIEDPKTESEKVVPKRQDICGKKDAPAYNDVIEETANKLVEKRKSKVKALVGAFETVISLQEPEGQGGQ